jgi:ribosomal protein L4
MAELAQMDIEGLTPEEVEVAKLAGQVYLRFRALPQAHPSDHEDVIVHVHAIQRIVMARAAIRAHPEHWTFK